MLDALASSFLFKSLNKGVLKALNKESKLIHLVGGQILFEEGTEADGLYVVVSGRLQAYHMDEKGNRNVLGEIGKGETVGELGLILAENRSSCVAAIRDSELLFLSRKSFERLIKKYPEVMLEISRLIIDRYRTMLKSGHDINKISTIAVIPASPDVPLKRFVQDLKFAFTKANYSACHMTEYHIKEQLPKLDKEKDKHAVIGRYLNELEANNDFVIYEGNFVSDQWSSQSIRQADRVIVVANSDSTKDIEIIHERLKSYKALSDLSKWDLVLLHSDIVIEPRDTGKWLDTEFFDRWYHVIKDRQEDYDRLVRWYTGNAVGLVLSGGGARGFAHIGVIKALREKGIPIDAIGGVSMGSLIAAEIAAGASDYAIEKVHTNVFVKRNIFGDMTMPVSALTTGERVNKDLVAFFGDRKIEDLWLPYFCVSCNLSRSKQYTHYRGEVWKAVRASTSLPGITPPVIHDGDIYVDGGIVNNLPSDVMDEQGVGHVIAVDVASSRTLTTKLPDMESISMMDLLSRKYIKRQDSDAPSIFSILIRSGTIGSITAQEQAMKYADSYLNIPLEEFGLLDWLKMHDIIKIGYKYTLNQIEKKYLDVETV
ncbi:patatin-like phospholipase family protein [Rickettsiales bacterium]|nr:patatin-like phospholipase family protein [Rickettsiales bacterium]